MTVCRKLRKDGVANGYKEMIAPTMEEVLLSGDLKKCAVAVEESISFQDSFD
jgi:hypothetical protein